MEFLLLHLLENLDMNGDSLDYNPVDVAEALRQGFIQGNPGERRIHLTRVGYNLAWTYRNNRFLQEQEQLNART